jgi:YidC/Oxa1 family membrane protein insertase
MITADPDRDQCGAAAAIIQPFALIKRTSTNATIDQFVAHSGPVGVFGGTLWDPHSYEELAELGGEKPEGAASWLGFTDQYWLGALVPGKGETGSVGFRSLGDNLFRADLLYAATTVPAGGSLTQDTRLYAGAKDSRILDTYEDAASPISARRSAGAGSRSSKSRSCGCCARSTGWLAISASQSSCSP